MKGLWQLGPGRGRGGGRTHEPELLVFLKGREGELQYIFTYPGSRSQACLRVAVGQVRVSRETDSNVNALPKVPEGGLQRGIVRLQNYMLRVL